MVLLILGVASVGVTEKLKPTLLTVPGTDSALGNEMLKEHFGESTPFAILLQGPPRQVERQGVTVVAALRRNRSVTVLSPWDRGAGLDLLRRSPRKVLILADFHVTEKEAVEDVVPYVERTLSREVSPPVAAFSASYAGVWKGLQENTITASRRTELIVMPILIIVLLLVFRSPIAAVIPLLFGAITVIAARGLISIGAGYFDMTGLSIGIASMLGLAFGVDYALLMVSRFREELATGATPADAAAVTRMSAGRTTIFAGVTLLLTVLVVACLVPGPLLLSICATVAGIIVLAVVGPAIVGPAVLMLVGRNIDRWQIPRRRQRGTSWVAISRGVLRRPYLAAGGIILALLLIAAPALSLSTGSPSLEELPPDDRVRLDLEAIEAKAGGGWISPSLVVLTSDSGPMTDPERLAALNRWQQEIARDPNVEAVIGPGRLLREIAPLRSAGNAFLGNGGDDPKLSRMSRNLGRAGEGLLELRDGLGRASGGAQLLATGSGRARQGAGLLADGLALAASGGARAQDSLDRFSRGANLLASGQRAGLLGASVLGISLEEADQALRAGALPDAKQLERNLSNATAGLQTSQRAAAETQDKLEAAWRELSGMSIGATDPRYPALSAAVREALTAASGSDPVTAAAYAPGYTGLADTLATLQHRLLQSTAEAEELSERLARIGEDVVQLRKLTTRLEGGIETLADGSERLASGSDRILEGAARARGGLGRLRDGAERLTDGLARLQGGNMALAHGLSSAYRRTRPLASEARRVEIRIRSAREQLQRGSPGLFDSGYFVLSTLDGAPSMQRSLIGQAVDLNTGGRAAKVLVVSKFDMNDPGLTKLNDRLRRSAAGLAKETDSKVSVTGSHAQLVDYDRAARSRMLLLIVVMVLVTLLALVFVLRAVPLAAITVVLNLLTAAAAFGVLSLLFEVPEWIPFRGTGDFDAVTAASVFGVVFGLSIDYAVFLLMRMREGWEQNIGNEGAISYGLERTAGVITGAATIMASIFIAFGASPVPAIAQSGIALTVAILLDATVIRLVLLPVLMTLIGPRVWWLPGWLDRRLPRLAIHG